MFFGGADFAVSRGWSYPRSFSPATMVSGQKLNTEAISPAMQKPQSAQMSVPSPMVILRNGQFYEFLRIIFYEFLRIVFLKKRLYLCGRLFMTARRFLNKRQAR